MRCHVLLQPTGEVVVFIGCFGKQCMNRFSRWVRSTQQGRRHKTGTHAVQLGLRDGVGCAILFKNALVLGFDLIDKGLTLGFDQNFDTRFVFVVAAAKAVVGTDHGFQIVEDLVPR